MANTEEKKLQDTFVWERSAVYATYGEILGYYQAAAVLENSVKRDSLLDLACGDGFITEILSRHFKRVAGADASAAHLETARSRVKGVDFYESLIEELELQEKFDVVSMVCILEHVENPAAVLKKVSSFLKDDGILMIQVPNSEAVNRKIAVLMGTLTACDELSPFDINIAGHRRYYDMKGLKTDVLGAGLDIVNTGGVFYKILSNAQQDWFLANGLWNSGFGWGRVGAEDKDWKNEFCRACYEFGKERPEDCNVIYAAAKKRI